MTRQRAYSWAVMKEVQAQSWVANNNVSGYTSDNDDEKRRNIHDNKRQWQQPTWLKVSHDLIPANSTFSILIFSQHRTLSGQSAVFSSLFLLLP